MCVITDRERGTVDVEKRRQQIRDMRNRHHETCPVCGTLSFCGLHAEFDVCEDGGVEASLVCGTTKDGYLNLVHGGVIASLLDGAMTNCLFSYGIAAVTGEMTTRMLHPVSAKAPVVVRAWLKKNRSPLYLLNAELHQDGHISAKAKGKFVNKTYKRQ